MTQGTPHDDLVQSVFSQPQHAAGLLRLILPAKVLAGLDVGALRRVPESFVDAEHRARHTDLLFACAENSFVYLLLEHQSSVDVTMPAHTHQTLRRRAGRPRRTARRMRHRPVRSVGG